MNKLALLGTVALAFAATPALGQAGGAPGGAPGGAGNPGGDASERLNPPDSGPGNAQEAIDRQGEFGRDFTRQAGRAQAYRLQLEEFANQTAGRREEAFAMRDAARSGQPVAASAKEIRDQLQQDMEDWRTEFRIDRQAWQGLRDEILVDVNTLTATQWADRRAQWFELRDEWIAQQVEQTKTQGG